MLILHTKKISVLLSKHNLNIAEIQNSSQEDLRQFELAFREKILIIGIVNLALFLNLIFTAKLKKIIE